MCEEKVSIKVIRHIDLLLKRIQHRLDFCNHLQWSLLFDKKLSCSSSGCSHKERCTLNIAVLPISLEMNTLLVLCKTVYAVKGQVKDNDIIHYDPFFDIIGNRLRHNHYYEKILKKVLKEGLVDENNLNYLNYLLNEIDY